MQAGLSLRTACWGFAGRDLMVAKKGWKKRKVQGNLCAHWFPLNLENKPAYLALVLANQARLSFSTP